MQVSIAVFLHAVEKFIGQRWLSSPRKNWFVVSYAYGIALAKSIPLLCVELYLVVTMSEVRKPGLLGSV